jgi:peroxiredoxin
MSKLAAAFALSLVACTGPSLASLAVGDAAPDFSLKNLDGQKVSLSSFKGKTVVLEWMNPNCPFSLRHSDQKTMASTADKYPDAVWLAINSTNRSHKDFLEPAAYKKFNAEKGVDYAVLYDTSGEVGKAYGASTTPHMFVVDGAGKIAYVGAIDDAPRGGQAGVNYVDSALAALAAGKSPDPAATKPYGCSVKY